MNNVTIAYHHPCSDGFCSAWLAHRAGFDGRFVGVNYGDIDELYVEGKVLICLDFSFTAEELNKLKVLYERIFILDHHATAIDNMRPLGLISDDSIYVEKDNVVAIFDKKRSGAGLTDSFILAIYNCIVGDKPFEFYDIGFANTLALYCQDRDLWQHKLSFTYEINALIKLLPFEFDAWDNFYVEMINRFGQLVEKGKVLVQYREQLIKQAYDDTSYAFLTMVTGEGKDIELVAYKVGLCLSPNAELHSDIGNYICNNSDVDFAIVFKTQSDKVSLRSVGDFNVRAIAEIFGGGGHHNAAGCSKEILEKFYKGFSNDVTRIH